jgi:hypothetical protein
MTTTLYTFPNPTLSFSRPLVFLTLVMSGIVPAASAADALYPSQQGVGIVTALCPSGMPVMGGGGSVDPLTPGLQEVALRQVYPISDPSGVGAFGNSAIGYQVASSDFQELATAFAICGGPHLTYGLSLRYVLASGDGVARAFCPKGTILTGGGALVEPLSADGTGTPELRQSYPISDPSGVLAFGSTAIGWQAASSDFGDNVEAFAVCAAPTLKAIPLRLPPFTEQYVSNQSTGVALAFCPAGTTLTGGGAFVESPAGFKEEKLRQSFPISDPTGVGAFGNTAIGWQAASSDFSDIVVAFAICGSR